MQIRIFSKVWLIVFLALIVVLGFSFKIANAQLPTEAGLGEKCNNAIQCGGQLFCNRAGTQDGTCVQCNSSEQCAESLNESCSNYVCTLPGGNNAGDLCADNGNCKSGLVCGARGICEEVSGFKKAFNYSCSNTLDCASDLSCSGGKCVQCATKNDCEGNVSACDQGVCVLTGGNPEGAWCTKGTQCVSGECSNGNLCLAGAGPGEAGKPGGGGNWMGIDLSIQDVADIINGLACWLTRIATAVMVIFLVLAGMRFMYARGNPTAFELAKKNFQQVLIGILVIMAVYVIIATVAHAVGRTDFSLIPLIC